MEAVQFHIGFYTFIIEYIFMLLSTKFTTELELENIYSIITDVHYLHSFIPHHLILVFLVLFSMCYTISMCPILYI